MSDSGFKLIEGTSNVFRDLGEAEVDLKQAKAVLDARGLSVRKAAALTGFAAADFSRTRNADLGRFTIDRLMRMLSKLDADIRITVHVAPINRHEGAVAT